jgi:hypothetical protein
MAANLAYRPTGLQSLALDEDDIYEYEKSVGDVGGIADLGAMRERLAKLGRFGDDTLAHVETGELIVPKPLLDKMPELKESILGHLREMGVEDPERYIVGSAANSINPETGSPEFFLKKVFRGIKSVGKFLKKAAPTIIKIAGTVLLTPVMGPIAAAALSSGIGTLVGGGSFSDALKSAAIGGLTGALVPGLGDVAAQAIGGAAQAAVAGGDVGDMLKGAALGGAGAAAGKLLSPGLSDTAVGRALGISPTAQTGVEALTEDVGKFGQFTSDVTSGEISKAFAPSVSAIENFGSPVPAVDPNFGYEDLSTANISASTTAPTTALTAADLSPGYGPGAPTASTTALTAADLSPGYGPGTPAPGPLDQASDYLRKTFPETAGFVDRAGERPFETFVTGQESLTEASPSVIEAKRAAYIAKQADFTGKWGQPKTYQDAVALESLGKSAAAEAQKVALANQPSLLARNPYLATVPLVAAPFVMGPLMETPEMEKPDVLNDPRAAGPSEELINQYRLGRESLFPGVTPAAERQTMVATGPTSYGYSQYLRQQYPELFAADGGGVFPRRTGGIMPDEGIPGKDSVKALVMPGEFIFTTDAVRGAGNGNLRQGINNMYNVMRNLEARGKRMA